MDTVLTRTPSISSEDTITLPSSVTALSPQKVIGLHACLRTSHLGPNNTVSVPLIAAVLTMSLFISCRQGKIRVSTLCMSHLCRELTLLESGLCSHMLTYRLPCPAPQRCVCGYSPASHVKSVHSETGSGWSWLLPDLLLMLLLGAFTMFPAGMHLLSKITHLGSSIIKSYSVH